MVSHLLSHCLYVSISNLGPTTEREIWHLSFGDGLCLTWCPLPCKSHPAFFFTAGNSSTVLANRKDFVHSSGDGPPGWLQRLSNWEGTAKSFVCKQESLRCAALVSPGYAGMLLLAPMADPFPGIWGSPILIPVLAEPVYTPTSKDSFVSLSPPAFLPFVFSMTAVLTGVRWNHNIVLICISDGECGWTFVFPVYRPFVFCIWKTIQLHSPFTGWEVGRLVVEVFKLLWLFQMWVLHQTGSKQRCSPAFCRWAIHSVASFAMRKVFMPWDSTSQLLTTFPESLIPVQTALTYTNILKRFPLGSFRFPGPNTEAFDPRGAGFIQGER